MVVVVVDRPPPAAAAGGPFVPLPAAAPPRSSVAPLPLPLPPLVPPLLTSRPSSSPSQGGRRQRGWAGGAAGTFKRAAAERTRSEVRTDWLMRQ